MDIFHKIQYTVNQHVKKLAKREFSQIYRTKFKNQTFANFLKVGSMGQKIAILFKIINLTKIKIFANDFVRLQRFVAVRIEPWADNTISWHSNPSTSDKKPHGLTPSDSR
jgi:hypothetical protein